LITDETHIQIVVDAMETGLGVKATHALVNKYRILHDMDALGISSVSGTVQ